MYRDLLMPKETNSNAQIVIEQKMKKKAEALNDENLSNGIFAKELYELCILNKMADSHR